jgi:hypothetical protein
MSTLFVRHGGKTLGPLAQAQIEWLLSRGKITRAAELSADRVNWQPLPSHPSFGGSGAALPVPIPISGHTALQQPLPLPIPISGHTTVQFPPTAPADDDYELTLDLDGDGDLDGIN